MKLILSALLLVGYSIFGFGQSLRFYIGTTDVSGTTITVPITANGSYANHIDVYNTTSTTINYKVRRIIQSGPLDSLCNISFCMGVSCFAASHNIIYNPTGNGFNLAGNSSFTGANGLAADFFTGPSCCDTYVEYLIFNTAVANDTTHIMFHYDCTLGVQDFEKSFGNISNAYPNPANATTSINYNFSSSAQSGKILFYDVLGNVVKDVVLTNNYGVAEINVADLTAGVYFYSLIVDDKMITTKKLMVTAGK